jgi:hypothetical protein
MLRDTGSISSRVSFGEDRSLKLTARRSSRQASGSVHPSRSSARMMSRPAGRLACLMHLLGADGTGFYRIHSGVTMQTLSLFTVVVGTAEQHRVTIEKERARWFAGLRPSKYRIVIDDILARECRGYYDEAQPCAAAPAGSSRLQSARVVCRVELGSLDHYARHVQIRHHRLPLCSHGVQQE